MASAKPDPPRLLVTGASGFIGMNLMCAYSAIGGRPHGVVRPGASSSAWRRERLEETAANDAIWHPTNLGDAAQTEALFRRVEPEIVIHAAAHGGYGWQGDHARILHDNIQGTLNVLRAAHASGARLLVNLGSSSEYGPLVGPMSETARPEPDRVYGVSKLAQTHLCRLFGRGEMKVVTLRLFSVYGPWEQPGRLLPNLLLAARNGRPFRGSSPTIQRDFIAVGDVCTAALDFDALRRTTAPMINLGTGTGTSLGELVRTVERCLGVTVRTTWAASRRQAWDRDDWRADTTLRERELHRFDPMPLEVGIHRLSRWLDDHRTCYEQRPS